MKNPALFAGSLILALFTSPVIAQIEQPILASAQLPLYPVLARMARVQGTVILEVTISPEGRISAATAILGNPLLRKAAEENVKTWTVRWPTITPEPKDPVRRKVEFVFRLSDKSSPAHSPFRVTVSGIERIEIDSDGLPIETLESGRRR